MLRLITVTGSRTNTLYHMLKHYAHLVDEMWIVVYEWDGFSTYDEVMKIASKFPNVIVKRSGPMEKFNWNHVTNLYNKFKMEHPNDWWVIADDDEFHTYSQPLKSIIQSCDAHGWELVRGGFVDRIGPNGTFPVLNDNEDIFKQFPLAGFFRYPLSGACPNKICIAKGYIELTPGQHYAKIDGQTTWKWQGWNHPLIAPTDTYSVQVHHFKWDSTCVKRIKEVSDINSVNSFSEEYKVMYNAIKENDFKIDITDSRFMVQETYNIYTEWYKLWKIIQSI